MIPHESTRQVASRCNRLRDDALVIVGEVARALGDHFLVPLDDAEIAALSSSDLYEALRLLDEAGEP
jgi:hypothetical protein